MERLLEHLHATDPVDLGFGGVPLVARGHVLVREGGARNALIHGADGAARELDAVRALGTLEGQWLGHAHEATRGAATVRDALGAPLHVHAADAEETARTVPVDATFTERHAIGPDLEAIPIPGHTAGATAYLWDAGEHRVLFTGDSVFLREGEWAAALLDAVSVRGDYVASLELLAGLEFDVLVPGVAQEGDPAHHVSDPGTARRRLLAVAERLRGGGDR